MSIEKIKDINKLRQMLKSEMQENKYLKECCKDAGLELQKHSFAWDGKEKNLVIQAMELNEKFEVKEQECEELKIYIESNEQQIKEVETLVMDNDRLINELNQLKHALSDIKKIVDTCTSGIDCSECPYAERCRTDIEAEALGVCKLILQKLEGLNE